MLKLASRYFHNRARMYHYIDVSYIPYLPTTVGTTLYSLFRPDLDFCRKQEPAHENMLDININDRDKDFNDKVKVE